MKNLIDSSNIFLRFSNAGRDSGLISHRSTQVTGQHRSLQVNYLLLTNTDIGLAQW